MIANVRIGATEIGALNAPLIVAEMSGNHNQSLQKALELVDEAANAGAHAIKLQTYTADSMTLDRSEGLFYIDDENSLWYGKTLYELYQQASTPWEWHEAIFARAKEKNIEIFSSPFSDEAVEFLEKLGAPAYKIASFENNHWPLLKRVAQTGKPVIISSGLTEQTDIEESIKILKDNGCKDIILLQCTSSYPAPANESNLLTIPAMREIFNCHIGLSDHTPGIGVAVGSVALGTRLIEKHLKLKGDNTGVDAAFSLDPDTFGLMVEEIGRAYEALGKVDFTIQESEKNSLRFKRSIYSVVDIAKGEIITEDNIRIIRPSGGLAPKHFDEILGKKAVTDIRAGSPLTFEVIA